MHAHHCKKNSGRFNPYKVNSVACMQLVEVHACMQLVEVAMRH